MKLGVGLGNDVRRGVGVPWLSPQTDFDTLGGLWLKYGDLVDGSVATFTSHEGMAQVLSQATGTSQPLKSATDILFDGGDSLSRSAAGNTAKFVRRGLLPDSSFGMSSNGAGKGWTITGLTRIPGTTQFWCGNHGDTSAAHDNSGPWAPSLIRINWPSTQANPTILQEIAIAPLIAGAQSIQGVTWDKSNSTLLFAIATGPAIGVYRINPNTGTLIGSPLTTTWAPNGLARVDATDKLWVSEEASVGTNIESRSLSTGSVVNAAALTGVSNPDMLFYDDVTSGLMLSNGSNGTAGQIRCYSMSGTSGAFVYVGDIILDSHSDCVEGIVVEGRKLYVASDPFYHGGADGTNQICEYNIIPPFAMDLSVHLRAQVVSIPSGADAYIECASSNGTDGPLSAPGSGFGIYDATATTLTAAIGDGTHSNLISGVTVPNLTAAFRNISLVASKTNNLMSLFVDGAQVGTQSLATHVGGIPLAGLLNLGVGNNVARLFNGRQKDALIYAGISNRVYNESYLSGL